MAKYARKLAEMNFKSETECDEIYYAALLHDVGKIGIPEEIIKKKGKLTAEEYDAIKQHSLIGAQKRDFRRYMQPSREIRWRSRTYALKTGENNLKCRGHLRFVADLWQPWCIMEKIPKK